MSFMGYRTYTQYIAHKHHHQWDSQPTYVTAGLTAWWDSTRQNGSESSIVDVIGGQNATHTGSPTFDFEQQAVGSTTAPIRHLGARSPLGSTVRARCSRWRRCSR